jgi:hypothetical protein
MILPHIWTVVLSIEIIKPFQQGLLLLTWAVSVAATIKMAYGAQLDKTRERKLLISALHFEGARL